MKDRGSPFIPNPALGGLMGVFPLAAAATSLVSGLALGAGVAATSVLLSIFIPATRSLIPARLRPQAALTLSAAIAVLGGLALQYLSPVVYAGLAVYVSLLAVNSLGLEVIRRHSSIEARGGAAALRPGVALREAAGFCLVATAIGALREILATGSLGFPLDGSREALVRFVEHSPMRLFSTPAGGFVLIGVLAAAYRYYQRLRGRRIP